MPGEKQVEDNISGKYYELWMERYPKSCVQRGVKVTKMKCIYTLTWFQCKHFKTKAENNFFKKVNL